MSLADACRAQAADRRALRRAAITAFVVGTVLTLANQGSRLLSGEVDGAVIVGIVVSYAVPFVVVNIGAVTARRALSRGS
jgi:hypothetical protein